MKKQSTSPNIRVLAIIPARGGSKSVPKKNILKLAGKPLIVWTIEAAKKSSYIDDTIVSTDSKEIKRVAESAGASVPFIRPKSLALDSSPTMPVMQHATHWMEHATGHQYTHIVLLEPTSPLRTSKDIDATIKKAIQTGADCVMTMYRLNDFHPVRAKRIVNDRIVPFSIKEKEGTPRQALPAAYYRNGSVYVTKRDVLMKKNSIWGKSIRPYIMPVERSIDIDDYQSFSYAEYYLSKRRR